MALSDRLSVLVAGASARALAQSAQGAGYAVEAIDAFADLDCPGAARALRRFTARNVLRHAARSAAGAIAYAAGLEHEPRAVTALAAGRTLLGNDEATLRAVRDPRAVAVALDRAGLPALGVRGTPPWGLTARVVPWLLKPRRSGGGHDVRRWHRGESVPSTHYLQEFVDGEPASLVFAAYGGQAVPLALTRQLSGTTWLGATGFTYAGNIVAAGSAALPGVRPATLRIAARIARVLAAQFGLVGLNGVDLMLTHGLPVAIEVNPRWCGSFELVERALGVSLFGVHADACAGRLPAPWPLAALAPRVLAKGIVYAPRGLQTGDTRGWLADDWIADVPRPRQRIEGGKPVCTIFADGDAEDHALLALAERRDTILGRFHRRRRRAAA